MITLTIPGQPVGKQRPRVVRSRAGFPIAFTPKKTVEYETLIRELFAVKYPDFEPLDIPLYMRLDIFQAIPKSASKKTQAAMEAGEIWPALKPDIDNVLKAFLDALNGVAYRDDSCVVRVGASKFYSRSPRVDLRIMRAA